MSDQTPSPRRPAGTPAGGQFAPATRAESGVTLAPPLDAAAGTRARVLVAHLWDAVPQDPDDPPASDLAFDEARGQARAVLAQLDEASFDDHWSRMCADFRTAARVEALDDPADIENLPAHEQLLDADDYLVVDEPDRPGEAAQTGVDLDRMRYDLTAAWRGRAWGEAEAAVREDDARRHL